MAKKKTPVDTEIDVLEPYKQSRIRTEMWLGSRAPHTQEIITYGEKGLPQPTDFTWVPAVFTAYREVVDNAIDEMVSKGHGSRLDITFNEDKLIFKVSDDGRGIPIADHPKFKVPEATLALSRAFSGRNFSDETRGDTRGQNGVGAAIVNFCSEWFKLDICRDKKEFSQTFTEGKDELNIDAPLIMPKSRNRKTGTTIEFKLSEQVFKERTMPTQFIRDRAFEVALCYPTLNVYFNGERLKALAGVERTIFKGHKPIHMDIHQEGFRSRFWLLPEFTESTSDHSHSLVNAIPVFDGGSHIDAFRRNFYSGLLKALETQSKRRKLKPNRSDISDGLLIFNITDMNLPSFNSQSKTRLINENCGKIISKEMDDPEFFKSIVRRYPEWVDSIFERCAKRTQKSDANDLAKAVRAAKRTKVEKLRDATSKNRKECVLFLGEGDSAISGLNEARDSKIHGGLPLRGKVLNVTGVPLKKAYENDTLSQIINSLGLIPGQRANRHTLRYGACYIATDADEDGYNICALLTNFFYKLWPELFDPENPFIYVFETPLIIAKKGKNRKYWFAGDPFDSSKVPGWEITRAKGLAALSKEDWKNMLAEPRLTSLVEDGTLKETLSLLFSKDRADDRKKWIGL